jgi:hypothetical protein
VVSRTRYITGAKITLIEDNLSAHKFSALYEVLSPARARSIKTRMEVVRTPTHGSWLNIAELALNVLNRHGLHSRIRSKEAFSRVCTRKFNLDLALERWRIAL